MYRQQVRQGDILLSCHNTGPYALIDSTGLPTMGRLGERVGPLKRLDSRVLAEGEKTGHLHVVEEGTDIELYEDRRGVLWLKVNSPEARVTHPEHAAVTVTKGTYEVIQQHEYDPDRGVQRVSD